MHKIIRKETRPQYSSKSRSNLISLLKLNLIKNRKSIRSKRKKRCHNQITFQKIDKSTKYLRCNSINQIPNWKCNKICTFSSSKNSTNFMNSNNSSKEISRSNKNKSL